MEQHERGVRRGAPQVRRAVSRQLLEHPVGVAPEHHVVALEHRRAREARGARQIEREAEQE